MTFISFTGNLASDPGLRYTQASKAVARLTVIENRRPHPTTSAIKENR